MKYVFGIFIALLTMGSSLVQTSEQQAEKMDKNTRTQIVQQNDNDMKLGAFSVSLSVKDLKVSKDFYENLGFKQLAGSMEMNYLIMKNGNALIGLFQGMFKDNIITFNPGWDESGANTETFDDVRDIQKHLKENAVALDLEADTATEGPASIMLKDPDGNVILIDQHR